MKLKFFLSALLSLVLGVGVATAYDFECNGVYYRVMSSYSMTCALTYPGDPRDNNAPGYTGDLVVPSTVQWYEEDSDGNVVRDETYEVAYVDYMAFRNSSLDSVTLPETLTQFGSNLFYNGYCKTPVYTSLSFVYLPRDYAGSYTVPAGITRIESEAFAGCSGLTDVVLPSSIETIGWGVFDGCTSLKSAIYTATTFYKLGAAYTGEEYTVPDGITEIVDQAFYDCQTLKKVNLPNSVEQVGWDCFPMSLEYPVMTATKFFCLHPSFEGAFVVPDGIKEIMDGAFMDRQGLTEITIPSSVETMGMRMFMNCTSLAKVNLPDNMEVIYPGMFAYCQALTSITWPASLKVIGMQAFVGCESFAEPNLPEGLVEIMSRAFIMSGVKRVSLPSTLTRMGDGAFYKCDSLEYVDLSKVTDTSLWDGETFAWCNNLKEVTIPSNIKELPWGIFEYCTSLSNVIFEEGVEVIGDNAFNCCESLTAVKLPKSLKTIGDAAFYSCPIDTITFGGRERNIGGYAFYYAPLTNLVLPNTVKNIGEYAFYGCENLESLYLGTSLQTIGNNAFNLSYGSAGNLMKITSANPVPPAIGYSTFYRDSYYYAVVTVPDTRKTDYEKADGWYQFYNIEEDPNMSGEIPEGPTIAISLSLSDEEQEKWNDIREIHTIKATGVFDVEDIDAGQIYYGVDSRSNMQPLTDMLQAGDTFSGEITASFDPWNTEYKIYFRLVDSDDETYELKEVKIANVKLISVSEIADKPYAMGEPVILTPEDITTTWDDDLYTTGNYVNNVNAGWASFEFQGIFPKSIGTMSTNFKITPLTINGDIVLSQTVFPYTGEYIYPEWSFTDEWNTENLTEDVDYYVSYYNNLYAGVGTVCVEGINNFVGSLTADFNIGGLDLTDDCWYVYLPNDDVIYTGEPFELDIWTYYGVGAPILQYVDENGTTLSDAIEPGTYDVYVGFEEGEIYKAKDVEYVGKITIYKFDDAEWACVVNLYDEIKQLGYDKDWQIEKGPQILKNMWELNLSDHHIRDIYLSNENLEGAFPASALAFPYVTFVNLGGNALSGDPGLIVAEAQKANPAIGQVVESLYLDGNNLEGNLGLLASCLPNLYSISVRNNKFSEISPMISPKVTNLDYDCQPLDIEIGNIDLSNPDYEALYAKWPSIALYNHWEQRYETNLEFFIAEGDIDRIGYGIDDAAIALRYRLNADGTTSAGGYHGNMDYMSPSGARVTIFVSQPYTGWDIEIRMKGTMTYEQGDVNFVDGVNVVDLQATISRIFGADKAYNFVAGNLWADADINVQDAIGMVNLLMDAPVSHMSSCKVKGQQAAEPLAYVKDGILYISSSEEVAAFDITLSNAVLPSAIAGLDNLGFDYRVANNGQYTRLLAWSLNGAVLPQGITAIADCASGEVTSAMLSNIEAERILKAAGSSSSINSLVSALSLKVEGRTLTVRTPMALDNFGWTAYSVDGRQMAKGADRLVEAGTATYDLGHMASGVYFIEVYADNINKQTIKIIIK